MSANTGKLGLEEDIYVYITHKTKFLQTAAFKKRQNLLQPHLSPASFHSIKNGIHFPVSFNKIMNSVLTYIRWIKDKPSFNPDFVIHKFLIGKFYCILVAGPAPNELGIEHSQCFGVFFKLC